MSDLEWLATHLGWTELLWHGDELYGQLTKDLLWWNHKCQFHRELNRHLFPRYDRSIDLMVELVQTMSLCDRENWTGILVELIMQITGIPDHFDYINAPASLRLKAYLKVMNREHT